jgi:hypothetical protein
MRRSRAAVVRRTRRSSCRRTPQFVARGEPATRKRARASPCLLSLAHCWEAAADRTAHRTSIHLVTAAIQTDISPISAAHLKPRSLNSDPICVPAFSGRSAHCIFERPRRRPVARVRAHRNVDCAVASTSLTPRIYRSPVMHRAFTYRLSPTMKQTQALSRLFVLQCELSMRRSKSGR